MAGFRFPQAGREDSKISPYTWNFEKSIYTRFPVCITSRNNISKVVLKSLYDGRKIFSSGTSLSTRKFGHMPGVWSNFNFLRQVVRTRKFLHGRISISSDKSWGLENLSIVRFPIVRKEHWEKKPSYDCMASHDGFLMWTKEKELLISRYIFRCSTYPVLLA